MEIKANYVTVGAFTILVFAAAFAFVYWVARVDTGGETARLDIVIEGSVTGLATGSLVKFNGIDVGKVTRLGFDASNPRVVVAESQVRRDLPITQTTEAVLSFTGLTGIAHIELEGGAVDQPNVFALAETADETATIQADPSAVNDLLATAQDIADRADSILSEFEGFAADARQPLTEAVENVTEITKALADNSDRIDEFLNGMGELGGSLETVAGSLERTLSGADALIAAVSPEDVDAMIADTQKFTENLRISSERFESLTISAQTTMQGLETVGARIDTSLDGIDTLVAAVDPEAVNRAVSGFADAGAAAESLAADARELVATLDRTATNTDALVTAIDPDAVSAIVADVRGFTADLRESTQAFDTMMASASRTLEGLEGVGERVDTSFDRVDGLLEAVDPQAVNDAVSAFAEAGRSVRDAADDVAQVTAALEGREADVDAIFANVTEMSQRLNAASARVDGVLTRIESFVGSGEGDGPTLMAEARTTLAAFRDVADSLNTRLDNIGDGLERFSDRGLRDVESLVTETRRSIGRIESAISSLERDPQRLLFGGEGDVKRFDGRQRR